MKYTHYTSIGENCEVAFQIRRVLGSDDSSFFSWNITPMDSFINLVEDDFKGIMQVENLRFHNPVLVADEKYGYMFHSDFPADPDINYHNYPEILENHKRKATYLIEKLYEQAKTSERILYLYKSSMIVSDNANQITKDKSILMRNKILKIHQGNDNFDLVIIQDESKREEDWQLPHIKNRYLARLAPFADATDGHVLSWDRVFSEFPHEKPLRLAGY